MSPQYLLSPHTYLCITDDHAVLLDLRRDKYVGVGRAQMQALAAAVKGWPLASAAALAPAGGADSVLLKMLAAGMLTTDCNVGKDASPVVHPMPDEPLTAWNPEERPRIKLAHALGFLRAATFAATMLRVQGIESVVARVRARKQAALLAGNTPNLGAAGELVTSYLYLRPLLFAARDACLFDSFTLIEFLAPHGVYPTWVFGVQTGPFSAHCWVQQGASVFNDTPGHVRHYTPILAV